MSDELRITEAWHWAEDEDGLMTYMERSSGGKWTTISHANQVIAKILATHRTYGIAPCGHDERFVDWEDHGKPIVCMKCEVAYLKDLNDKLYASMADGRQQCEIAEDQLAAAHGLLREACKGRFEHGEWISWVQRAMKEVSSE